ncbi:MAG: flagellar hook-associated protein FlgK [Syntrophomonadaceae bacterium]|jgi:flagellar hook-associated protein 1 FlgK|nr:flagellar hook-associated protein FlgK [Syntrophomonadaceae bacterium]
MSFFGLEIGKKALMTNQAALTVTGHNIANVDTPGYSRQIAALVTTTPLHAPSLTGNNRIGQVGTGVDVDAIYRVRDALVDRQIRYENQFGGYWDEIQTTLSRMEVIINEPTKEGLREVMDQFWQAWEDLAGSPESTAVRAVLAERGAAVADAFQHTYKQLQTLREDLNLNVKVKTDEINSLGQQIGELNLKILTIKNSGKRPNDLEDKRDLLLDQLSEIVNIDTKFDENGSVNVKIGNRYLVQGMDLYKLDTLRDNEGMYMVVWEADQVRTQITSGQIGAYLDARGRTNLPQEKEPSQYKEILPNMIEELNSLAKTIIIRTNSIHETGFSLNNQTTTADGTGFFAMPADPADQFVNWAEFIQVASAIVNDSKNIAAAAEPTWGLVNSVLTQTNAGDGKNALLIAQLKQDLNVAASGVTTGAITVTPDADITFSVVYAGVKNNITVTGATYSDLTGMAAAIQSAVTAANPGWGITVGVSGGSLNFASSDGNFNGISDLIVNGSNLGSFQHLMIHSVTADDYWRSVVANLGVERQEAIRMNDNQDIVIAELIDKRDSISGVSIDEEGTNIIKFQNAYNASARFITTIDEMLDVLISRTGVVGR